MQLLYVVTRFLKVRKKLQLNSHLAGSVGSYFLRSFVICWYGLCVFRRKQPPRKAAPTFKSPVRSPNNPSGKGGRPKGSARKLSIRKNRQKGAIVLKSPEVVKKRGETYRNNTTRNAYIDHLHKPSARRKLGMELNVPLPYRKPQKKRQIYVKTKGKVVDKFGQGWHLHCFWYVLL